MPPINEFSDPALQMERREFFSMGCGACVNNIRAAGKQQFVCRLEVVAHPDATAKTCIFWKRKNK